MKIDIAYPQSRDEYCQTGKTPCLLLDISQGWTPVLRAGTVPDFREQKFKLPFALPPQTDRYSPEDVARCMDHVRPMVERLAEDMTSGWHRSRISNAIMRFLAPEDCIKGAASIENLSTVPLQ